MDNFKHEVRKGILILAGVFVIFAIFLILSKNQIGKISERVAAAQGSVSQQRTISSQLIKLREDKELADKYTSVIKVLIPTRRQSFELKRWVENQGQVYGLGVTLNYAGEPTKPAEGALGDLAFTLKLSGNMKNILSFLDFLENKSPQYLMSFDDLGVSTNQSGGSQAAVKGKIYFRSDE